VGSQIAPIEGHSYIEFMIPGLVMMSIITNAYMNVSTSFYTSKFQRSIEELLVSPTSNATIILGYCLAGTTRALITGAVVTAVACAFCPIAIYSWSVVLLFAIMTALLFSAAGLINAVYAQKFDDVTIVPTFVLTPLTYLGGVFYSVDQLPPFWGGVSKLNPVVYMISGLRYGFLGVGEGNLMESFGVIFGALLVVVVGCYTLLSKGVGLKP
jgi:ABC-2 type transport system permease protein